MIRAVFDTNVVVSGVLSPDGPPGRLLDGLLIGEIVAVVDDRILGEYHRVLQRPHFGLPRTAVTALLAALTAGAEQAMVPASLRVTGMPDMGDAPFLECAWAAQVILITGNLRHYPKTAVGPVRVLSPREFLEAMPRLNDPQIR